VSDGCKLLIEKEIKKGKKGAAFLSGAGMRFI
jgi:hypothetical protein